MARNRIAKLEKSRLASKVLALLVANQSPPTYTTPALSRIAITRGSSLQEDSAADMIVSIVYGLSSVAPTRRSYARPAPPLDLAPYSRRSIHGSGGLYKTQPWNIFEIRDVERPKLGLAGNCAGDDGEIDFTAAREARIDRDPR